MPDLGSLLTNFEDVIEEKECSHEGAPIPVYLKGTMLRNGPGIVSWGDTEYNHWFDGDAYVQRYAFRGGKMFYSARAIETSVYLKNKKADRIVVGSFGTKAFPDPSPREVDREVIRSMLSLQIDKTEYLLLKSLIVCNPCCESISERARVILHQERDKLSKELLKHCMNAYGNCQGPSRFGNIVALESTLLHQALKSKHLQSLLVSLRLRPGKVVLLDEICEISHLA